MLTVTIEGREYYNEQNEMFITTKSQTIQLEHSLVSISKWESKWHIPFLNSTEERTLEQSRDYVRCMTLTQNVPPEVYNDISQELFQIITAYIDDSMTATWFSNQNQKHSQREIVTSELIYYWMVALEIPFECQKWHLNRLMTLIQICNIKNVPPGKTNKREMINRNRELNEARKKALKTTG